ncbi:MAG: hypothetical protein M0036_13165 [Desulfobacteraceae bacterium]|nr:hypothetical protein [Desulfobacteraceae bacterium]
MKKIYLLIAVVFMTLSLGAPHGALAYDLGGVQIHGFVSQGFLYSDDYNYLANDTKDGSFEYNEMGINFGKQLTDKLRIGLQLFSRDLGDAANNKVTVDWAYADYRWQDYLGLRAGRIKLPMGLYNETRDMDMLRTSIVLPQGIYNDLLRDNLIAINGVGLYGNTRMGGAGSLDYQALVGVVQTDPDSGVNKLTNDGLSSVQGQVTGSPQNDTSYVGALRWETPLSGLKLGYSIFYETDVIMPISILDGAIQTSFEGPVTIQIASIEYTWRNLVVAAEYMHRRADSTILSNQRITKAESYYLMASYRFNDWFTLGSYYSEFYPDTEDKDGSEATVNNVPCSHRAWEKDLALTLRFDINDYWVFKIEGHSVNGTANVIVLDNPGNDFADSQWYYGAAKLSFSF